MSDITIWTDRTFLVGRFPVRVTLKGMTSEGEAGAVWSASVDIPYREGEDAPKHFTLACSDRAYRAVLALAEAVSNKADVVIHLTPHTPDGNVTPLYRELTDFSRLLNSFAWGTVLGWDSAGAGAHGGHPSFEELTQADAA